MMADPGTARAWPDDCLQVAADLSRVTWVLLANRLDLVPPLLRTRCRIVRAGRPRPQDFGVILRGALRDIAAEYGGEHSALPDLDGEVIEAMRAGFQAGRLQARQLAALVRRVLVTAADAERRLVPRH
jgi:ATP-dependent Lon protease